MSKKGCTNENNTVPSSKRPKKLEALQELVLIKPDIKGKEIYFFPTLEKCFKGVIIECKFETFSKWIKNLKIQRLFQGHRSALATNFLEPNPTHLSIGSLLNKANYTPYWKKTLSTNMSDILSSIKEKILPGQEFCGTANQEIIGGFENVIHIHGTRLINHTPFALLEKNGQIYRHIEDCRGLSKSEGEDLYLVSSFTQLNSFHFIHTYSAYPQ
ncbi:hypothetical protein Glove_67g67 [Diversispora epigaea]|uniref:Uncharacterized protein n=1 Tax=Diversispora epigaea TaxID=1348612 RepID=A0A397JK20_9GLOM|nr:hypothetical protein Glove_67g67 [Diversispora epigaea]